MSGGRGESVPRRLPEARPGVNLRVLTPCESTIGHFHVRGSSYKRGDGDGRTGPRPAGDGMSVLAHSLVAWLAGLIAGTALGFVIGARRLLGPGGEDGARTSGDARRDEDDGR